MDNGYIDDSTGENEQTTGTTTAPPDVVLPPEPEPEAPEISGFLYTLDLADTTLGYTAGMSPQTEIILQYLSDLGYDVDSVSPGELDGTVDVLAATSADQPTVGQWAAYNGDLSVTEYGQTITGDVASVTTNLASTAYGYKAYATGARSTAIGRNTLASGEASTALGDEAQATGATSTALGKSSIARATNAIALGVLAAANAANATAVGVLAAAGSASDATKTNQTALGTGAQALAHNSVALGNAAVVSSGAVNGIAIGQASTAGLTNAIAIGQLAGVIGTGATNGIAIGTSSRVSAGKGIAIGISATASATSGIAVGDTAKAEGIGSLAIGIQSRARGQGSFAFGQLSYVGLNSDFSMAIGDGQSIADNTPYVTQWGASIFKVVPPLAFTGSGIPQETKLQLYSAEGGARLITVNAANQLAVNGVIAGGTMSYIKANGVTVVVTDADRLNFNAPLVAVQSSTIPSQADIGLPVGSASGQVAAGDDSRFGTFAFFKNGTSVVVTNPNRVAAGIGLVAVQNSGIPTQADIYVDFAGTGSANTVARSDHTHPPQNSPGVTGDPTIAASGTLATGSSRTLITYNFTGLDSSKTYTMRATAFVEARNNVNAGSFQLGIRIGGSASYPEVQRTWDSVGGVPGMYPVSQSRSIGGATSVNVVVRAIQAAGAGDPVDFRQGIIIIDAIADN